MVSETSFLIGLLALASLVPSLRLMLKRRVDPFEPIHWASAYFALLFVVRPLVDLTWGSEFVGTPPFDAATERAFDWALVLALLGYIGFVLGYYAALGRRIAHRLPAFPRAISIQRFHLTWPVLLLVGLFSFVLLVAMFGGWSAFIDSKGETLTAGGQGYVLRGVFLLQLGFVLTMCVAFTRGGFLNYGIAFLLFLPAVLFYGLASGSKGQFVGPLLSIFVCRHYLCQRVSPRALALFVGAAVVIIPAFNAYRHTSAEAVLTMLPRYMDVLTDPLVLNQVINRFYGIDALMLIVRDTPLVMDFQFGATLLPLFTAWIPRQLWEDKPVVSFGKVFGETYMAEQFAGTGTAPSPTLIGEAFLNWHLPGVLVVAWSAGVAIRAFYVYSVEKQRGPFGALTYASLFLSVFLFWEKGLLGNLVEPLVNVILIAVLAQVIRGRERLPHP